MVRSLVLLGEKNCEKNFTSVPEVNFCSEVGVSVCIGMLILGVSVLCGRTERGEPFFVSD